MLSLYRSLLALRRSHNALSIGDFAFATAPTEDVLAYYRRHAGERFLIALNLSDTARSLELPPETSIAETLCSTLIESTQTLRLFDGKLAANEGLIMQLNG